MSHVSADTSLSSQYPTTAYNDYSSTYSYCGILPTKSAVAASCPAHESCVYSESGYVPSLKDNAPSFTLLSHPPIPDGVQPGLNTMQDPRGWTYQGVPSDECDDANVIQPLFPSLNFWSCQALDQCAKDYKSNSSLPLSMVIHPNIALQAAMYLTATSTSTEAEETAPASVLGTTTDQPASAPPTVSLPKQTSASQPTQSLSFPAWPDHDTPSAPAQPTRGGSALYQNPSVAPEAQSQSQNEVSIPQGKAQPVGSQIPSPEESMPQINYVPLVVMSTNAEGVVAETTTFAVASPIYSTSTNKEGKVSISTGFSTLAISASIPTVIASTNAQGGVISSTFYLPAIALTTTNAQGSKIITTSSLAALPINPPVTSPPAITVDGHIVTANPLNQYLFDGQTLTPGGVITASGIRTSLSPDEASVLVGTSVQNLATAAPPALTIGGQTIRANSMNQYIFSGQTLTPGGVISISGTRISLSPDEASLVVGTSVENLAITTPPPLTIDGQTIIANSENQYIIDGQTLTRGGVITASGTRISLSLDEASLMVGTSLENLAITTPPLLTVGSQTITANSQHQYVIDGQTLTPGGIVTVFGTRISLSPDETAVVVGTSTEDLGRTPAAATGSKPDKTQGSMTSNGSAADRHRECWLEALVFIIGLGVVVWL